MNIFDNKCEIDQEYKIETPEKTLWIAVLCRAALDAVKGEPQLDMASRANVSHKNYYTYNRDQARHFFLKGGWDFKIICEFAGRNPVYVQQKMRTVILRKNGWNVDVPITSSYRMNSRKAGRKRGRYKKKHLTGNAYYAAKAKKNFYYQGIGSKGGRPRIYNKIKVA